MANIIQMDETTYRIEDDYVRYFLLIGTDAAALIDSGVNSPDARKIAEEVTDLPVILVNTHGDGDHTSGTGAFDEIFMAPEDYENCGLAEKFPGTVLRELEDGEEIYLGDRTLQVVKIPGHTKGSIAILDKEKRQLFAGDSVQNGTIFMFGKHRRPDKFEASLNKLISLQGKYSTIIASHGDPVLPKDYAGKVLVSWKKVRGGYALCKSVDVKGNKVKQYDTQYCGFYCD